ncbi:NF-kappa-B inhibitor-like protein 1 [Pocillopora verrucosa]|uniref:NF-kappa-B inhibitor-like protein 1 n=1 Tax=Pocillopora verrucosa TaxID=203993 RepID=UPI00333EFB10
MGKSTEEKLFYYITTGKLHRVRSLFKKHEASYLTALVDRRGRTALHACCLLGDDAIMRLLLKNGANVRATDSDGNTPIHLALRFAVQTVRFSTYNDLIVPLLNYCDNPHVLDERNNEEKTPREYLTDLKRAYAQRREELEAERKERWHKEHEEKSRLKEDLEWERKLQFEESQESYSKYCQDDYIDNMKETYDEWADRITYERRQKTEAKKQQKRETRKSSRLRNENEQKARERTRQLEKEHEAYVTRMSVERQKLKLSKSLADYESNCTAVFCSNSTVNLTFVDIPWPTKGGTKDMIALLGNWSEIKTIEEKRKFLKEQQVRWHPDKFLQRCGNRLDSQDRVKIIEQVNELSKEINALVEAE